MDDHECIIGLLHYCDYSEIVTLHDMEKHRQTNIGVSEKLDEVLSLKKHTELSRKWLSMRDYADKRKSTNLTRFDYCPFCGKKINWKDIRRTYND